MTDHEQRTDATTLAIKKAIIAYDNGSITAQTMLDDIRIIVAEQLGKAYDAGFADGVDFQNNDDEPPTFEVDFEDEDEDDIPF